MKQIIKEIFFIFVAAEIRDFLMFKSARKVNFIKTGV